MAFVRCMDPNRTRLDLSALSVVDLVYNYCMHTKRFIIGLIYEAIQ